MAESTSGSNNLKYGDVYNAAINGEKVDVLLKRFYTRNPTSPINDRGDTVLHLLSLNSHTKAAVELLNLPMHGLSAKNCKGNTALHEAARVGALEIAELMVKKEKSIVTDSNLLGETPLYWAAAHGQTKMLLFLAKNNNSNMALRRNDGLTILHAAVMGQFYDLALQIMVSYPELALARNENGITALHILGRSPVSFKSGTLYSEMNVADSSFIPWALLKLLIYFCIPADASKVNLTGPVDPRENEDGRNFLQSPGLMRQLFRWFPCFRGIDDTKQKHVLALELVKALVERASGYSKWNYEVSDGEFSTDTLSPLREQNTINEILVLAVRHGIVEIVDVILEECPWAIEFQDENEKNILHLTAEYHQAGVFKLLKSRRFLIHKMSADVDKKGNTALHLVANYQRKNFYAAAYEMTWEKFWFRQVKDVSQAQTSHIRNSEGKTANEIFDDNHQKLLINSVEWAKKTTNTFMVISTLIATVNFTAAFAVPGGYDQTSGLPIFSSKARDLPSFYAYSTVALFFSVVALGSSFSAYLSRFHSDDFHFYLPFKYLVAGSSLFYSTFYAVFAYIQGIILARNGLFTSLEFWLGFCAVTVAITVVNLVFIDILFPVFRYVVDLLIHLIFHRGQWM